MGALEDYVRSQRKVVNRNNPMRDSVMSQPAEAPWVPDAQRVGGHALEAPMVSPDDLIGTGLPSKAAMAIAKLGAGKTAMGGLGMLIGSRGAERLGSQMITDLLGKEMEKAALLKRQGLEYRNQHNSKDLRVHTGFDGKPWYETGDADLLPFKSGKVWDKEAPILDQWRIPETFRKAYEPELSVTKLENSTTEPLGTGVYWGAGNNLGLGHSISHHKPEHQEFFQKYPMARDQRVRSAMSHELTHLGQRAEGAVGGTTPEYMGDVLRERGLDTQFEKYLMKAGIYRDLAEGKKSPLELMKMYSELGMDNNNWRGIERIIQNSHKEDPNDLLELSQINTGFANNIMQNIDKRDTLQELLNNGISYAAPHEIKLSAKKYGQENPVRGLNEEQVADLYTLYRANAGEAQAEQVSDRLTLPLSHSSEASKRTTPFFEDFPFPPDFLHSVR